jgi:hypothetical protein
MANYDEIQTIFSFGLATGMFAMGLGDALGTPLVASSAEDVDTQESDMVILGDPPDVKPANAPEKVFAVRRR